MAGYSLKVIVDTKQLDRVLDNALKTLSKKKQIITTEGFLTQVSKTLKRSVVSTSINEELKKVATTRNLDDAQARNIRFGGEDFTLIKGEAKQVKGAPKTTGKPKVVWSLFVGTLESKDFGKIDKKHSKTFKTKKESLEYLRNRLEKKVIRSIERQAKNKLAKGEFPIVPNADISVKVDEDIDETTEDILQSALLAKFATKKQREKVKGKQKVSRGKLISRIQFEAIFKQHMLDKMPKGPIGGRPRKGSKELTYRTGKYWRSIRLRGVVLNAKKRAIRYWYNPIYFVHEDKMLGGQRDPRRVLVQRIRQTAKAVYGSANFFGKPIKSRT